MQKLPEYDIFQKTLICTLTSSLYLGLKAISVAAGQYLEEILLLSIKTDHFWYFNALLNKKKLKRKFSDNLGQNILILFHFLVQFAFTTIETELDCYHQKVNVRVASRVS